VLRAWSPLVSAMPAAESTREVILEQLVFRTRMTPEYARLCLEETGWDLEKAIIAFDANKSKLPIHAFMTPSIAIAP